jgi:hypothetical protein
MSFLMAVQPALAGTQGLLIKVPMGLAKAPAGDLSVTPNPGRFPDGVAVGSPSAPLALTVTNNGFSSIQNVVVGVPGGADEFTQDNTCGSTLAGKSSCTISVTFKPTSSGERTGTIAVSSTASNGLQLIPVSGLGVIPSAALAVGNFPATQVNESSTATATLTNSSTVALKLTPVDPGAPFSIDDGGTCSSSLPAGASCTYKIKFSPVATGAAAGTFKVGLAVGSFTFERSVALAANASAPSATLSIGAHGNVAAGQSKDVTGTLTNTGVGALTVGAPSVTGAGFSVAGTSCSASLPAGDSCDITVRLTAAGQTAHTGTLSVPTLAGVKTAPLSGQAQQAVLDFSPTSLDFGTKQTNGSYQLTATLRNTGNIPSGAVTLSAPSGYAVSGSGCTAGLAAGANCTVTVTFNPTSAISYSGKVSASAATTTAQLSLSGTSQDASATIDALDFGNRAAGSSATMDATLTNTGVGPLTLGAASVTGAGFSVVAGGTCASTLAAGATCKIRVQLTAAGTTLHTGTLSIATTEAGTKTSSLRGQSQQAIMGVSPLSRDFGNVQAGQSATSATHTISNTGNIALTGLTLTPPAGYSVNAGTCSTSIAAGGSCAFTITFSPGAAQAYNGNVAVASSNAGTQNVAVTGSGQSQSASISDVAFGNVAAGATSDLDATLSNTGIGPLSITVPTAASVTGAGFSFVSTTCSSTLAASSSCAVKVRYTASGTAGATGSLSLSTGAGTKTAALSGQSQQAILGVTPTSRDFGTIQAGQSATSANHTVSNTGNITLTGLTLTPPAGYSINAGTCSTSIAAGGSCAFTITFSPGAAQAYNGNVAVASSNAGTQNVAVTGSGQAQSATITDIAYGSRSAGAATDLDATLSNTGIGPLTVTVPTAASVTGAGFSFVSTTCSSTLAAGSSCAVKVRYTASGTSAATGSLVVSTGAGSKTSSLNGQSQQGLATLTSPASITLADWYQLGTITGSFTYRNDGNIAMTLASPSLASPLSVAGNTCTSVAAGSSCTITVALTRNANSGGTGAQSFSPSGAGNSPATATANWSIYSALPRWGSTSLAFGTVQVGQTSSKTVTITNDGSVAYNWASNNTIVNLPAGFTFDLSACSNVVPNGSCNVTVSFSPTAAQAYSGTNLYPAASSYQVNALSLSGTGAAQAASITGSLNFGSQPSGNAVDLDSTLTNSGVGPLSVTVPTAGSVTGTGFSLVSTTCTSSLAAGATCAIKTRYTASGTASASGSLTLSTGAGNKVTTLSGQSLQAIISLNPTSLSFGSVQVGQGSAYQGVTITNTGNTGITGLASSISTGFNLYAGATPCGTTLAAGASCSVNIQFAPAAAQTYSSGYQVFATNAATVNVTLSGIGTNPSAVAVGPTTYSYDVPKGTGSGHRIAVQNNGSGPITVNSLSYAATQGNFYSWWASAGTGSNGNYCSDGLVLQPGQNCGAWVQAEGNNGDVVKGTATINTSAGNFTFNATYTVRGLTYSGGSGSAISPTGGQTGSIGTVTINNSTPFTFYFVNYGVNGGASRIGRFTGGNEANFAVNSTSCSASIAPGSSCTVNFAANGATSLGSYNSNFQANGTFQQTNDGNNNSWSQGQWNPATGTGIGDAWTQATTPTSFSVQGSSATLTSANSASLGAWYGEAVKTAAFTYRNDGNSAMTLNSPGLSAPLSVASNTCSGVAPGASCTITVALTSTAAGNGGSSSQTFTPSGATTSPAAATQYWVIYSAVPQWSSTSLAFGNVLVGQSSSQNITLYNYGSVAYNWAANSGIANQPGGFSFDTSACSNVAPNGGSCNVRVTFTPGAAGGYGGGSIYPAAASYVNNYLTVSGTGVAPTPSLSLNSTSANFGTVSSSGPWSSGTYTLTNSGTGAATGVSVSSPANFGLSGNSCSGTLAAGSSCSFVITATPPSPGTYSGNTVVSSTNGGTLNISTSITLSQSVATLTSASSITLADWYQSGAITGSFTYRNDGNSAMTLNSPSLSSPLSVSGNSCSGIAPGGSCTITVALTRNANGGGSGSQSFTASGATVAPAGVNVNWSIYSAANTWATTSLSFGSVNVGSSSQQTVSVTNSGSAAINWSGALANLPSGFSANTSACSNVAPGGSCSVTITFTPSAGGNYGGGSIYPSNISYANNYLTVSGTGVALTASISVSPTTASFGTVNTGSTSSTSTHTVTAGGNTATTGISISAPSGFNIVSNNCGTSLAAGSSCTFGVTFSPSAAQGYSGNVTVASSNGGSPTVAVSGTGQAAAKGTFTYMSSRYTGAKGSSGFQSYMTVKNTGTGTITGITTSVSPSFSTQCPSTSLAPGATMECYTGSYPYSGVYSVNWTWSGTNATNSGVVYTQN